LFAFLILDGNEVIVFCCFLDDGLDLLKIDFWRSHHNHFLFAICTAVEGSDTTMLLHFAKACPQNLPLDFLIYLARHF
jgi:hypothetical protein